MRRTGTVAVIVVSVSLLLAASRSDAAQAARVDVVLWFDTEDYLLPASDDAAKRLAELLSQRGIRATFKVVGEKARVLERRGRADVIAALRKHDIGYHSNFHSVHPTPAEYLADCGLLDGVAEFVRHERQGAADVRRIFGRESLACYGQPGSSWACQAIVALKDIGVGPVYLDDGSHVGLRGKPFWYAGALNAYDLGANVTRMDLYNADGLEQAKAKVTAITQRLAAEGGGLISIYYHPCEFVHQKFWDGVNFSRGANPPREQWKVPPQLPAEQTEQAFSRFAKYIDHIKSLGVRFVTASELPAIYADRVRSEGLTEAELLGLASEPGRSESDRRGLPGAGRQGRLPGRPVRAAGHGDGRIDRRKSSQVPAGGQRADGARFAARFDGRGRANDRLAGVSRCGLGRAGLSACPRARAGPRVHRRR